MKTSIKKLADKYFNNLCTPDEAEKVLQWLDTEEGMHYLNVKIESDFDRTDLSDQTENAEGLNSDKLLASTAYRMKKYGFAPQRRTSPIKRYLQIAAGILVIAGASFFYQLDSMEEPADTAEAQPIYFNTNSEEQRNIRLGDGTRIQLNSHSELIIPADFMEGNRQVELKGEAFFDVENKPGESFMIQTGLASVEVLGTAFNVKHTEGTGLVEVSVVQGKVIFEGRYDNEQHQVTLGEGDYAYWNDDLRIMNIENFGSENYLAWMTGELLFDNLPLSKVCVQMNRFYNVTCAFETADIEELGLNATIPNPGLENMLSVIALSLNLEYKQNDGRIEWSNNSLK